jgi:hypothetical protein
MSRIQSQQQQFNLILHHVCVPSQQLQGQLQKQPSADTVNYITDRSIKATATWPILEIAQ